MAVASVHLLAAADADLGMALAAVVVFGVGAQLLASRIRIPSILLLLLSGLVAGPGLGVIEPDQLLGDLQFPLVSLAVGILLFEGGLGLRFRELERQGRGPILRLITIGVLVTWVIGSVAVALFVGLDRSSAVLLGAILVVSGPTVVLPLLRFVRVREPVNSILRWEGIFIDPVGATLAIVVLDAIITDEGAASGVERVLTTTLSGTAAGLIGAAVLTLLFSRHWVPDNLHNPFTLAVVVGAFAVADLVRPEAGLFAATVMGVALANQRFAPVGHIREFEEDLGQLILAGLFVVLGASIDPANVAEHLTGALAVAAVLIFVARPLAVYLSTVGSGLRSTERAYLVCVAPRGIVAASVSALFALELEEIGQPVEQLVPVTFTVIVVTVLYSTVAARVGAGRFRVGRPPARGIAFIGAPPWALDLAAWLGDQEIPALVVTNDPRESVEASMRGVLTYTGKLDSEDLDLAMESVGISSVLAVSRLPILNSMAIERATESVGRANVYHLPDENEDHATESPHVAVIARRPFHPGSTQGGLDASFEAGARIVAVDRDSFDRQRLRDAIPLLEVPEDGAPNVVAGSPDKAPSEGTVRVYLVAAEADTPLEAEEVRAAPEIAPSGPSPAEEPPEGDRSGGERR